MIGKGKIYVVVNKDLKMSSGKVAAQVAHTVARLEMGIPHVVIVLEGTTDQLWGLDRYLQYTPYCGEVYIDEGANEVPPMSPTALAFGMVEEDEYPDFVQGLELYKEKKTWLKKFYS